MAVLYGISGKATGKKGDTVFSVRKGQQIMRQYNPIVADPKSDKQIDARAKMKLLSQMSAIMADVLAIPAKGPVTSRNIFTKKNYGYTTVTEGVAELDMVKMQITNSARTMVNFSATRAAGQPVAVALDENSTDKLDRVVYVMVNIDPASRIGVVGSAVAAAPGADGLFAATLPACDDSVVILAYGMKDTSARARVAFANIEGVTATQVAKLITSRAVNYGDAVVTETLGLAMGEGATSGASSDVERFQN